MIIADKLRMWISCVIPAYNEETRIRTVLDVVSNYKNFLEIIIINDGSEDNTLCVVKNYISNSNANIKLIDLKINTGKTNAVKVGVESSNGNVLVFVDADLRGLTHDHLNRLIYPIITGGYGLTILDRPKDRSSIIGWTGLTRLFGGERALWKEEFLKMDIPDEAGYSLETLMNMHFLKKGIKVKTVYAKGLDTAHHMEKDGLIKGVKLYLRMFWRIYKDTKIINLLIQSLYIEDDRLTHRMH